MPALKRDRKRVERPLQRPSLSRMTALSLAVALFVGCAGFFGSAVTADAQIIGPVPAPRARHIYSETANPKAEIASALAKARRDHKRVILDFGGDWCPDCQVLDIYFHQSPNAELLDKNFVLVHVWIGQEDAHLDIAHKYGVPVTNGVPGLAVLAANGSVLYSQGSGEFRDMRTMNPASVTEFLKKWKS
jgi:thiol:disulfide interchange protein